MALTVSDPVARQSVVFILLWKLFAACQLTDDVIKKVNIQMAFHCQLVVFLELICPNDVVMFVVHSFNALNASSTSE